ncbi:MAG: EpsG family protein [Ruminococcus sp.]|nr:EpsG family protein [Ruminococcus sp.]
MTVMIVTVIAVAVFALLANSQYKRATAIAHLSDGEKPKLTSYYLFVFICAAILAGVAGLRFYVGADFGGYYWGYLKWLGRFDESIRNWSEPGLSVLAKILYIFTDDGAYFILLTSVLTVFMFVFPMAKYSEDFFFVVMLYVFTSCWSGAFNGVRQYMAAAVFFAGHRLLYERKFIRYCILVFLAASFHITALIMLPMYFIISQHLNYKKIFFIIVFGIVLVFSYDTLFSFMGVLQDDPTSTSADTTYAQNEIHPLRIAIAFAPILLYLFMSIQNKEFSGEENFYICFMFVNAAVIFGTANSAYLNRAGIYFRPFIPLSLYHLVNKFDKSQQLLLKSVILILYAIVWIYIDAVGVEWSWVFERGEEFFNKYGYEY